MLIVIKHKEFQPRVQLDTDCPRGFARLALLSIAMVATLCAAGNALAKPVSLPGARVIWQRAGHVYVVLGDSTVVEPADTLLLDAGKKEIAKAAVVDLAEGGLIVGLVHSGSLDRERRLDRLRVRMERRALPSPAVLRFGVPSATRAAVTFGCDAWMLRSPSSASYRVESTGRLSYRMIQDRDRGTTDAADAVAVSWPDTILVSLFDDAAEQEIALERGDVDVALFGPGELSSRLRNDPRWRHRLFADGGALADSAADSTAARSTRHIPFPVLTPPDLVPYVRALGPSEILRMLDCGGRRRGTP